MTHSELTIQSSRRLAVVVGTLCCILCLVVGCSREADQNEQQNISAAGSLSSLMLEGPDLHESLHTRELGSIRDLPTGLESPGNPHLSTDYEFVESVARGGSQGRLGREGIHAALFARYSTGDHELGFYGLEAKSEADAAEREKSLREIWAHNGRYGRSRVHRKGLVLLVIWHNDVSPECWESVNAMVLEKLNAAVQNDG